MAAGVAVGRDAFGRGVVDWSESEPSLSSVAIGRVLAAGSTGPTELVGQEGKDCGRTKLVED